MNFKILQHGYGSYRIFREMKYSKDENLDETRNKSIGSVFTRAFSDLEELIKYAEPLGEYDFEMTKLCFERLRCVCEFEACSWEDIEETVKNKFPEEFL